MGTLIGAVGIYATSWCEIDLTFDLAVVPLIFVSLSWLCLVICGMKEFECRYAKSRCALSPWLCHSVFTCHM